MFGLEDDPLDTDKLDDRNIIARTAWGEARGLGAGGMHATINTIQNRFLSGIRWWGHSLRTICLHSYQFSCWDQDDPNRSKLMEVTEDDREFRYALQLSDQALAGKLPDIVNFSTHYYDKRMAKPPEWAFGLSPFAIVGNHWYYKAK